MARPQDSDSMAVRLGGHQNKEWAENKNSFGFKMLQKMGWKEGNGLGKHEDGQNTHVRVKKRSELEEGLGIGAKIDMAGQAGWGKTAGGFDSLLQKLNKEYGGSAGGGKAKKAGQKKEGTKEERKAARKAERKAERKAARKRLKAKAKAFMSKPATKGMLEKKKSMAVILGSQRAAAVQAAESDGDEGDDEVIVAVSASSLAL